MASPHSCNIFRLLRATVNVTAAAPNTIFTVVQMHMHCNKLKSDANANAYALQQAAAAVLQAVGIYLCSSPFLYLCIVNSLH